MFNYHTVLGTELRFIAMSAFVACGQLCTLLHICDQLIALVASTDTA